MPNLLKSDDFGQKIYNRFPPRYREDDVRENFALKRYLESLSDGGFKHVIEEINGLTSLIDPDKVDSKNLPMLFRHYGLEIFNGIPENYLRYLLPRLGEAWAKKGSLSVVEFITSSLSGILTSTDIEYDDDGNPLINVKLEMDYNIGDYFPEAEQFVRLLQNFVPFNSDVNLVYSYLFYETQVLSPRDSSFDEIKIECAEEGSFSNNSTIDYSDSVLGRAILGLSVLGGKRESPTESYMDNVTDLKEETATFSSSIGNSVLNNSLYTLNNNFYTNGISSYDIITINGKTEIVY